MASRSIRPQGLLRYWRSATVAAVAGFLLGLVAGRQSALGGLEGVLGAVAVEILVGLVVCVLLLAAALRRRSGLAIGGVILAAAFVLGMILFPGGRFFIFDSGVGL